MTWTEARKKIETSLKVNSDSIDKKSIFRNVRAANDKGFSIGKGQNQAVSIPWTMLETIFISSKRKGYYDNSVFKDKFEDKLKSTSCYVRIVGNIFCVAGIMKIEGNKFIFIN
jgi:hypothetical protein